MSRIPATLRTKRNTAKSTAPLSPEEKFAAQEKGNCPLRKRAEDRMQKAVARAEKRLLKTKEKTVEIRDNVLKTAKDWKTAKEL